MAIEKVTAQVGNSEFIFEAGHIAKQAHGSVTLQCGGTVILATAVAKMELDIGKDFFPLMVDYRERTYAAGKIPGGYFKREGRPTEREILTCRLIDRPIRSLSNKDWKYDTQLIITVLSSDGVNPPDILAMNGAAAALFISDIPFENVMGAVRVGLIDGEFIINPSFREVEEGDLDLILAGTDERIVMIEAGANELSEEKMMEALKFGHEHIKSLVKAQKALQAKVGKARREIPKVEISTEIQEKVASAIKGEFDKIFKLPSKEEREAATEALKAKVLSQFDETADGFNSGHVKAVFGKLEKEHVREMILSEGKRPDGRGFGDLRKITCEVGVLPRTHGSAVFTRGQTQALAVTTLGTGGDEQRIDSLEGDITKRFMLHYNFPPFSVGEVGRTGGPGRREIGHGALAERSLKPIIPHQDDFPYTIRLVSDILESNGSSSMASVCGGTLSLMDAGVPIKAPVAGIAIGLITGGDRWKVLTDIAGIEDYLGDMDFKAAGTAKGLTALQMDLKIAGVTDEILLEAFKQAKDARFKLLDCIKETIAAPREDLSQYAPRITTIRVNPEKIGMIIGPGGKVIRKICEDTGAEINIEDDGRVHVSSVDADAVSEALAQIELITQDAEIGRIYEGKVRKLMGFGAFIEILPGKDGMCHVSEIADGFVKSPGDFMRVGDIVPVKVIKVEDNGKVSLSIKEAKEGGLSPIPEGEEKGVVEESAGRGGGRDRGSRPRSRR
ncbi:MAG: polyribonucleotide nucleotidyltransferase [Candidatus Omnitrophota bacterium]|nr:polyribonucleotide nucleotidyltransferase [Candidatus Omnitrophota bacterium]